MKAYNRFLFTLALLTAGSVALTSCNNDDDDDGTPPGGTSAIELTGDLPTQTLSPGNDYLLKGQVFVRDGEVLTILPGTVIKGDKATRATLIVDRGGRIEANGTLAEPIVMTSAQPAGIRDRGDWGGLVILGRASTNQPDPAVEGVTPSVFFGGNPSNSVSDNVPVDDDNSGTYRYLRVEFAGIELTPNNETNSITMGGVGRGTQMEYNMVSFGGDDGFEWFGGTVNGKYFISQGIWDDDFDCDYGWSGNVQYGLVVRYPSFADQSGSNAFECDNGPNDNDVLPYTTGTFSNVTVVGPIKDGNSISSNYNYAMDLRRRTAIRITNSVLSGFPRGLRFNQASVQGQYESGNGVLFNNYLSTTNPANTFGAGGQADVAVVQAIWEADNETVDGGTDAAHNALGLKSDWFFGSRLANDYPSDPDFTVTSGPLTNSADFSHPIFSEPNRAGFFDNVEFIGAFGAEDWTDIWTEFDAIDAQY